LVRTSLHISFGKLCKGAANRSHWRKQDTFFVAVEVVAKCWTGARGSGACFDEVTGIWVRVVGRFVLEVVSKGSVIVPCFPGLDVISRFFWYVFL
jgi:hypothetical protein